MMIYRKKNEKNVVSVAHIYYTHRYCHRLTCKQFNLVIYIVDDTNVTWIRHRRSAFNGHEMIVKQFAIKPNFFIIDYEISLIPVRH